MIRFPGRTEVRFYAFLEKHALIVGTIAVAILGIGLHLSGWYLKSNDYLRFLDGWYNQIAAEGGLLSLGDQVGNYNIPYQTAIAIMTYLPISARSAYKLVSCLFDIVLAVAAGMLVFQMHGRQGKSLAAFAGAVVFALPTVVMNSGWWAQCDSIWVSFCLLSLVAFNNRRNVLCFLLYGCAFAFKLQAVFLLPFFLFALVRAKRISILHFCLIPVPIIALSLPGLVLGRSVVDIAAIYTEQAGYRVAMYLNYPSFWALFVGTEEGYSDYLKLFAIILTVLVLFAEAVWLIIKKVDLNDPVNTVTVAALFVFTTVFFLPAMHERYAYLAEVLLVAAAFADMRFLPPAVLAQIVTMKTYLAYLMRQVSGADPSLSNMMWPLSIVNAIALCLVAVFVFVRIAGVGPKCDLTAPSEEEHQEAEIG